MKKQPQPIKFEIGDADHVLKMGQLTFITVIKSEDEEILKKFELLDEETQAVLIELVQNHIDEDVESDANISILNNTIADQEEKLELQRLNEGLKTDIRGLKEYIEQLEKEK